MKRWAKSYSIIDHELLHSGYFSRLSHEALALYLFYVVVGDREGKSFYARQRIERVLRFNTNKLNMAQIELISSGLITNQGQNVWVNNLGASNEQNLKPNASYRRIAAKDPVSQRRSSPKHAPNREGDWSNAGEVLTTLLGYAMSRNNSSKST